MEALAFGNPALLWGLLAAGLPLVIHLISRRRARKSSFAAVEFLLRARQQQARQFKLKQLLLLLMRTALVLFIALALAKPLLRPKAVVAASSSGIAATSIILDASLSMRYRLKGQSLFEQAQNEARAVIDSLPGESSVNLVICDGQMPQVDPPGFDRAAIKQKIQEAQASYRAADLGTCMNAAARSLAESPIQGKKLYILSDLTLPALRLDQSLPKIDTPEGEVLPEVVFIDAAKGEELPNLAVVDVKLKPSTSLGSRGFEITTTVRNSGSKAVENVPLSLKVQDQVLSRGFVDVPAKGSARKVLAHRFEPGTALAEVSLPEDALVEDDSRAFVLRVAPDVRALVVNGSPAAIRHRDEAFFVEAALGPGRTGGRITTDFVDADAAQSRSLAGYDVVLLLNVLPPRSNFVQNLKDFVKQGGGLFVSLGDNVQPEDYNATFGDLLPRPLHLLRTAADPEDPAARPARFSRIDFSHPALQLFSGAAEGFDSARVYRYAHVQPDARKNEHILATWDDGAPALIESRYEKGKVLLYTSTVDRDWTDWPIRTSFLPAIQQLTSHLAGALDPKPAHPVVLGEERRLDLEEQDAAVQVLGPDGKALRFEKNSVRPELPGHHRVRSAEGRQRELPEFTFAAVIDPRETDTQRHDPKELALRFGGEGKAVVAAGAHSALPRGGTPLWTWLLLGAIAAFFAEGVLTRKG